MRYWLIVLAVLIVTVGLVSRAWDYQRASYDPRQAREIAVLLCSHHWTPSGRVTHERPRAFAECVQTYNATGRVP